MKYIYSAFIFCCLGFQLQAQNIYITFTNGTETSFAIVDVKNITFDVNIMNVNLKNGTTQSWHVDEISFYKYEQTTSIADVKPNPFTVQVYPNPSYGVAKVLFEEELKNNASFKIFDLQGKQVYHTTIDKGIKEYAFQTGFAASGTYFIQIQSEKNTYSQKIILQ